jgi:hypothetical protein
VLSTLALPTMSSIDFRNASYGKEECSGLTLHQ